MAKTLDGTGAQLDDNAEYFVQDARSGSTVGNCGSWWAPNGGGYVCCIDDAGRYKGSEVHAMRESDIPWPVEYVLTRTVRHVRVDNAFSIRDGSREAISARMRKARRR